MGYLASQLGITSLEMQKLSAVCRKMVDMPVTTLQDAAEQIKRFLVLDEPVVIDRDNYDGAKLAYPNVKYYINFRDIMSLGCCVQKFSSILGFLIRTAVGVTSIDRVVVPHDGNLRLGAILCKSAHFPLAIMRSGRGRIFADHCWEGHIGENDRVLIVHDVLATADQIIDAKNKLPKTCKLLGVCCLIARTDFGGIDRLKDNDIPLFRVLDLNDREIQALRDAAKEGSAV
jgi:adenine/guanine phosphoribosyltransferase-like PRPP-binding protein